MIEPDHPKLSISRQCELLDISRATYYYEQRESRAEADLEDLKRILEVLREIPFYGYRKISRALMGEHPHLTRKRVRRIMRRY
ncbi:HTH-like domain-containing protein [Alkalispirochaeta americana]|uniref:HTH-like domain-containing protein n=1 Tax=Alkalispirochaeta americana TaxID=159291 RepID=A0A1N6XZX6_9SPIO|nr:IS3 family transposase [Alkalispirochaeta americana]SIR07844.1 HTH-like domain-containing protein [Alkalispirochaeta americana]